ncbi:MAG: RNA polymerase sigma factor [Thermoleophilaceae bacterium]
MPIEEVAWSNGRNSKAGWDWSEARRQCIGEARRVLRSPAEIEDAAQEALLRVWRSARTPQELERPAAWLRRIARNEALRVRAREGRRRDDLVPEDTLENLAAPADRDGALPERLEIVDLMATLSPGDRQLVWLRYFEDLTQENVARRLGIPEGTVKVRLHRVRGRLRGAMEGL